MNRKNFLKIYYILFILLSSLIFFGLKTYSQKNFNDQSLQHLVSGNPKYKDVTDKLCSYKILGDPDVGKNYIKINFWCSDNTKARSTFDLKAFKDKTFTGIITEYARIIGFDSNIIKEKKWHCTVNDKEVSSETINNIIEPSSTIDCFETKGVSKHD